MTSLCHASSDDSASGSRMKYFEFMGLELLSQKDGTDEDASNNSSYSSYCNDSLELSGLPKKIVQRRSSTSEIVKDQSSPTMIQRSPSVEEMLSWLSRGEDEDELDLESSFSLARTKPALSKALGVHEKTAFFSSDVLASQAVAGGAGRAA